MKKISKWLVNNLPWLIVAAVALMCTLFIIFGTKTEDGTYTLDGKPAQISDTTKKWIESASEAMARIMNQDKPTDEETIKANAGAQGKGFYTTIDDVLGRRLADGNNDNGNGWQCSRYTGWLGTGQWSYSSAHPDYGPVNGKDVAQWLVDNYGYKYIDEPVRGAIGSGGFNTLYGHTAMYLYSTGEHTAMVNDANYVPLTVSTHNMNIDGWVWVVPGSYEPEPEPTPKPEPEPEPVVSVCDEWTLRWGDTLGLIMQTCEGYVEWGESMRSYARTWVDKQTGMTVLDGWNSYNGIGLYAGHTIKKN